MFKGLDYTPNVSSVNNVAPSSLGNSKENKTKPKSVCGCKNTVAAVSGSDVHQTPFAIVPNNKSGYYGAVNVLSDKNVAAFDELGPDEGTKLADNASQTDEAPVKFDYMTHVYISSLAIIGLFALYRLIHKTR
jgi:hypothetical protein